MKKNWYTPKIIVQSFEPSEYVASCWKVACNWSDANKVEKEMPVTSPGESWWIRNNYDAGQIHRANHCGTSGNQIIVTGADGVATGMYEINSDTGVRNLTCTLYTGNDYNTPASYGSVEDGQYIYWTTGLDDGTTWYHQGTVNNIDAAHPNRS